MGSGLDATTTFAFAVVLFAFGETIVSPTLSPMVQDLATDQTRGRYSAAFSMTWMVGSVIGPALAGFFLDLGKPGMLFSILIVGCLGAAWLARDLENHIPPDANVVHLEEAEEDELTAPEAAGLEVAG